MDILVRHGVGRIFTAAPESSITWTGVSIILTSKIGFEVWDSCAPTIKVHSSLPSLSASAGVKGSLPIFGG